jgi:hypothetical protein
MHNQLHKFWPELINIFYYDWAFIKKLFPGLGLPAIKRCPELKTRAIMSLKSAFMPSGYFLSA